MDVFIDTEGLWHIPEFIFGLLSYEDLKNCCQVSTKWKWFLTRQHGIFEDEENIKEDLNFVSVPRFTTGLFFGAGVVPAVECVQ